MALNKTANNYKKCTLALVGLSVVLTLTIFIMSLSSPLVVIQRDGKKEFQRASSLKAEVTEDDIRQFSGEWVKLRFEYDDLDAKLIVLNVRPYTSEGLSAKLLKFIPLSKKGFNDRKVSQYIANVDIEVGDDSVIVSFDKILRIDGVPLISPSQVSLRLTQGSRTKANPLGLYVHGVTEHKLK